MFEHASITWIIFETNKKSAFRKNLKICGFETILTLTFVFSLFFSNCPWYVTGGLIQTEGLYATWPRLLPQHGDKDTMGFLAFFWHQMCYFFQKIWMKSGENLFFAIINQVKLQAFPRKKVLSSLRTHRSINVERIHIW